MQTILPLNQVNLACVSAREETAAPPAPFGGHSFILAKDTRLPSHPPPRVPVAGDRKWDQQAALLVPSIIPLLLLRFFLSLSPHARTCLAEESANSRACTSACDLVSRRAFAFRVELSHAARGRHTPSLTLPRRSRDSC